MVELEASTQKDDQTLVRWKKPVLSQPVTLGRAQDHSDWTTPWDDQISRKHIQMTWDKKAGRLVVQILPTARNPVYHLGRKYQAGEQFSLEPGKPFIIGGTLFRLTQVEEDDPAPDEFLRTVSHQELRSFSYADADARIEVLSTLPEMIRQAASDAEFEERLVELLLQGVPRALMAALVWMDPATAGPEDAVRVQKEARRGGIALPPPISRHLVHSAVCKNRQTVLRRLGDKPEPDSALESKTLGISQWAICAPLRAGDDTAPGLALYVAGEEIEVPMPAGQSASQLQDSDLKFIATVAEVVAALRDLRGLQKKQTILSRFFSSAVMSAIAGQDIEEVLKPRVSEVTCLCCDLRGSCRIAEEGESDLTATCDRVSAALEEMTTRITEQDGVISDFQGDSAMSFWGWPQRRDNDAQLAARAALAISRGFTLLASRSAHPLVGFACGLGLATGTAIAGRLGTMDQFKIGVFGPTINLAARLESLTKLFRVSIVADDATARSLKGKANFRLRRLAMVQPYGMAKQLMVHEVLPPVTASEVKSLSENQRLDYEAALDKFTAGAWEKADPLFARLRGDGPSQFIRGFMREHEMRPPPDWAGVIVASSK